MDKRVKYLQTILQQSLDKFTRLTNNRSHLSEVELVRSGWENFLNNKKNIAKYDKCISNFESLVGFGRELSKNLSIERLISKVAERFAEIDLAEHIIREYSLEAQSNNQLEKLIEKANAGKTCDFRLQLPKNIVCFEAKYTSSIFESSIKSITKKALTQILETDKSVQLGVVWIFTYQSPKDPGKFQDLIERTKDELTKITAFHFLLTVQTYSFGYYGDSTVIF